MSKFSGGSRIPMERFFQIIEELKKGQYPNCSSLAKTLECSTKTIQRDIHFLQERLAIPLVYNSQKHGYELTAEVQDFPVFDIEVEDLAALFLARQAMAGVQGTRLAERLKPAFEKLTKQLHGKVNIQWSEIDEVFSVKDCGVVEADLTLFGKLAEAVLKQREVRFQYCNLHESKPKKRKLQPYHVGEINGGWYVIGRDIERDALRTFALQRMRKLEVKEKTFARPQDFQIGEHLGGSIGIWDQQSDKKYEIAIEVSSWVARVVQERVWHKSQKIKLLDPKGEKVLLTLQLGRLEEIKQLVLGWGSCAKVIGPPELRRLLKHDAEVLWQHYKRVK